MNQQAIPSAVGDSYDPETNDYIVVRHVQVGFKATEGWKVAGEVEDTTTRKGSTMVIMERKK